MLAVNQAPTVPDPSALADLDPGVAYMFLAVVLVGMVLFYFGPALRDRFGKKTPTPPVAPPPVTITGPVPAALPAVMDRSAEVTDQYIGFLKAEIEKRDRELDEKERELERLRADLRDQWRRGAR